MLRRSNTVREQLRQRFYPYYELTAPLRPLPNAVIIGGMKCGTTSLNAWLRDHPKVAFSSVKEIHFFDKQHDRGSRWYRTHFPLLETSLGAQCVIEATPSYLYRASDVAERMANLIPEAKLIAMLRDPVKRAISHYGHMVRNGKEDRPAEVALLSDFGSNPNRPNAYKQRGLYAQQLAEFFRWFPRSQVMVIKSELFFANAADTYRSVQQFVNISEQPLPARSKPRNVGQKNLVIPDAVSEHLREFYKQPNQELQELLPNFSIW